MEAHRKDIEKALRDFFPDRIGENYVYITDKNKLIDFVRFFVGNNFRKLVHYKYPKHDFKSDLSTCYYCKQSVELLSKGNTLYKLTKDHVFPKSLGGKLDKNFVYACNYCKGRKGDLTIQEWRNILKKGEMIIYDHRTTNVVISTLDFMILTLYKEQ